MCLPGLLTAASGASAESWTCHKADLTRHVLVFYPQAPAALPCKVFYTKPNENVVPRPLWEADNTEGYCERKAAEFVAKLVSWGWRCALDEADPPAAGNP
jgi:hypothetical protein